MEINIEDLIHSAFSFPTMIGLCFLGFGYMFGVGITTSQPLFTYGSCGFFLSAIMMASIYLVDKAISAHLNRMEEYEDEEQEDEPQPTVQQPQKKEVKHGIPKSAVVVRSFSDF